MPTESASTTSSTVATKLAELDRLIAMAVQAQQIAVSLREMAEAKSREIDKPLPLFPDIDHRRDDEDTGR